MTAIQRTIHVGEDGILRLELPVDQKNRDLKVVVVVETSAPDESRSAPHTHDPWAIYRARLEAAGFRVPTPGSWAERQAAPLEVQGAAVSQTLVEDRR
jgi:hypothetical protein